MKKKFVKSLFLVCFLFLFVVPVFQANSVLATESNKNISQEDLLEKIKVLESQNADKNSIAKLYIQLADLCGSKNDYKQSLMYDKSAFKLLTENNKDADQKLLAVTFMQIGMGAYAIGNIQASMMGYLGAIETLKKNNMLESKGTSYNDVAFLSIYSLAEIYKQLHEYDKAKEFYNLLSATQTMYNPKFDLQESMVYYSLGYIYQKEKDYEQALKKYNLCIMGIIYYKHQNEKDGKELIYHSFIGAGESLNEQGKYNEAIKAYNHALPFTVTEFKDDYDLLARLYNGLGLDFYKQNDYEQAKLYYEKAIAIYEEFYSPKINKQDKEYQTKLRKYFPRKANYIGCVVIVPDDSVFEAYKNLIDIYKITHCGNAQKLENELKEYEQVYSPSFRKLMEKN